MNDKYPPLPEPFYDRGDFGAVLVDCYNDEQMRAYADAATYALRTQLAEAQRDAERYRAIKDERVYIECPNDTEPKWYVYGTTAQGSYVTGADLDAAIDAAKGENHE